MKKIFALFIFLINFVSYSQVSFIDPIYPFENVNPEAIASGDLNRDGFEDVIVSGKVRRTQEISTALYLGDGTGSLIESDLIEFPKEIFKVIEVEDLDKDGDLDIWVIKSNRLIIYDNQGNNSFIQINNNIVFWSSSYGTYDSGDIDFDGDIDIISAGGVFINEGNTFSLSEVKGIDVDVISSIAFVNGDIVISGIKNTESYHKLYYYRNNGSLNFQEELLDKQSSEPYGTITVMDVDNDNELDILVSNGNLFSNGFNKMWIYKKGFFGTFTRTDSNLPLLSGDGEGLVVVDIDRDFDLDVIMENRDVPSRKVTVYENDEGTFIESNQVLEGSLTAYSSVDLNNDNFSELILHGDFGLQYGGWNTLLYSNSSGTFVNEYDMLQGNYTTAFDYSDIDGDLDIDLLILGQTNNFPNPAKTSVLYLNNGLGNYEESIYQNITPVLSPSLKFLHVDNDDLEDLVVFGRNNSQIYLNDGEGVFSLYDSTSLPSNGDASIGHADFNNDGYDDFIICGNVPGDTGNTTLFMNNQNNGFEEIQNDSFMNFRRGEVKILDFDHDNDLDIVLVGMNNDHNGSIRFYVNDGNGNFSKDDRNLIDRNLFFNDLGFVDINGDGNEDLFVLGPNSYSTYLCGEGFIFSFHESFSLELNYQKVKVIDVDTDGDIDVLLTSTHQYSGNTIFLENDNGSFISRSVPFSNMTSEDAEFADLDGNGTKDLILMGSTPDNKFISRTYINDTPQQGLSVFTDTSNSKIVLSVNQSSMNEDIGKEILIAPNPANNSIKILNSGVEKSEIYGSQGGMILSTYKKRVDISQLQPGIYFVRSFTSEGIKAGQFVKE